MSQENIELTKGEKIAQKITGGISTWRFIFVFLFLCIVEIAFNHTPSTIKFHFDPQTIILNLILSLIAAIQGSVIMIAQKQTDAILKRMIIHIQSVVVNIETMLKKNEKMEKKIVQLENKLLDKQERMEDMVREMYQIIKENNK